MSYSALVCRVHTRPHPNADRLQLGTANGYQVIVGLDVQDGELGVFFGPDGQLSQEMCDANDLIGYTDPDTHERRGGYFPKNRRVRSQKLRGVPSDGFWTGLSSFVFTGVRPEDFVEGQTFTELNGIPICNKYITEATRRAAAGQGKQRRENIGFPKHIDTKQLKHYIDSIPEDSIIYITEKLHGTSGRYGLVYEETEVPLKRWEKLLRRKPKTIGEYKYMNGTRNVVMADHTHAGYYGNEEFRFNAVKDIQLHKGEVLYFELVGYTTTGTPIMSPQNTSNLKKELKGYANPMVYSYGNESPNCDLYVYRITRADPDGNVTELSWPQVKRRCGELGLKVVPDLVHSPILYVPNKYGITNKEVLGKWVDDLTEGSSTLDTRHIREGVVIRVEAPDGTTDWYKNKSFTFGVLEGYLKDSDDYVDLEESS